MSVSLGFIGTGTITQAIVTGLCRVPGSPTDIWVSPRSQARALHLASSYPNVHVAGSNQEVLDRCEVVMLAVLPQIAPDVLGELRFQPAHRCISLIAGFSFEALRPLIHPSTHCIRATPTPCVAYGKGPVAICPRDEFTCKLFSRIGEPVAVDDEHLFSPLLACSSEMASYFRLLQVCGSFLAAHGLPESAARRYPGSLFAALGHTAMQREDLNFAQLALAHATPRGLNEQLVVELSDAGVFAAHHRGLERVLSRVRRSAPIRPEVEP